jgi:hypothetical protein
VPWDIKLASTEAIGGDVSVLEESKTGLGTGVQSTY